MSSIEHMYLNFVSFGLVVSEKILKFPKTIVGFLYMSVDATQTLFDKSMSFWRITWE